MSFTVASIAALWIIVIFLAAALSGLLREVRKLQERPQRVAPLKDDDIPSVLLPRSGTRLAAVLIVTEGCPVCTAATATFSSEIARHLETLTPVVLADTPRTVDNHNVEVVVEPSIHARFFPGWSPALMFVDQNGTVVALQPAGSEEAIVHGLTKAAAKVA